MPCRGFKIRGVCGAEKSMYISESGILFNKNSKFVLFCAKIFNFTKGQCQVMLAYMDSM